MFKIFFGLRFKLVLLSAFLLTIPWLGYQYVWEMEKFLVKGQEKTLVGTVSALATALHERPNLLNTQASYLKQVEKGKDLYAYPINRPIQLDGEIKDWREYKSHSIFYGSDYLIKSSEAHHNNDISFEHLVGQYGNYLYAYFEVTDNNVIYRAPNLLSVDQNDHLRISVLSPNGEFERFVISPKKDGWINAYLLTDDTSRLLAAKFSAQIQGHWKKTDKGYNVELRMPLNLFSNKLSFSIADFDEAYSDEQPLLNPKYEIGTSNTQNEDDLGSVLVPSPEIESIIKGMSHTESRLWVVDKHRRVLAQSGQLENSHGVWAQNGEYLSNQSAWQQFETEYLHPLYYKILTRPPASFVDQIYDSAQLEGSHIRDALGGKVGSTWRLSSDNQAVILSAATPIWLNGDVVGAVIAEETTNGIRTLRNKALEKLFNVILAVMGVGALVLFLFASHISSRIRTLRNQAEQAIDEHGRITEVIKPSTSNDEIGDLSRSFASVVSRLSQYTHYLENMSSRLSHELRTPVAVVRSSLDNLALTINAPSSQSDGHASESNANVYISRAQEGISRLNTILTNMSEATRLEQTLKNSEVETFNLTEVVSGCMQGYQLAYPEQKFELSLTTSKLMINGCPDYIAQLLDKLVANAREFSQPESPVVVNLIEKNGTALCSIKNFGSQLPEQMHDRIFDSMVSLRPQDKQQEPHLGIGLYIARLIAVFHQGSIKALNITDENAVKFLIELPLIKE